MNAEARLVTDAGLAALKGLASDSPQLFIEADATALEQHTKERAGAENIWGPPLDLRKDLSDMNRLDRRGPETDAAFAPLVRAALGDLPPAEGLNEHRWATLNCFVIPKYVVTRWQTSNIATDPNRQANFVQLHWLRGGTVSARQDNAAARLWWLGELSERAAASSEKYDADEMLDAMANNVNLYHQLLARPVLISRPRLLAAIYEVFGEDGNDYLRSTKYANELIKGLNLRAASVSFDLMTTEELRQVIEEAKPPKGP